MTLLVRCRLWVVILAVCGLSAGPLHANERADKEARDETARTVSPARGIRRGESTELLDTTTNAAHQPLRRLLPVGYADGFNELAGGHRPSPREISNTVLAQSEDLPNHKGATDYLWQWGQFIDHDIDLTDGTNPPEPQPISVPSGDPEFDPAGTGTATIAFNRSLYLLDDEGVRQQINEITGWIDASHVYGSDATRAAALRALDGTGRLAVSDGDLLPFNTAALANAGGDSDTLFLAGDVRANEQVGLTALHTLFVREHNYWADKLRQAHPDATGEEIFQAAKRRVIAEMQHITFAEFLPVLVGRSAIPSYQGFQSDVDPRVFNAFSTSAFRLGHSLLSPQILRLGADGLPTDLGPLLLRDAFFNPTLIQSEGIEPILRGLAGQVCQSADARVIDEVRNFLFGPPGAGGFDLVSLNIQRGRDHGLPSYNETLAALGGTPATSFDEVTDNPDTAQRLALVYASVADVDLWVGSLSEEPEPGSLLGSVNQQLVVQQFVALRDGDPNWYERVLDKKERREVRETTLSDIVRRNTGIGDELPNNVFLIDQGRKPKRGRNK